MRVNVTEISYVKAIHEFANIEYWRMMMDFVQTRAQKMGFAFEKTETVYELPDELKTALAYEVGRARAAMLLPELPPEALDGEIERWGLDGGNWAYVDVIIRLLRLQGISLKPTFIRDDAE